MRVVDIIAKKRDGGALTAEEIDFLVQGYSRGEIPDYQAAAWLMAVYLRGMSREETVHLTQAIVRSGRALDLKDVAPFVVDKHSTGGVGDKTTLVIAPLVAATDLPVAKVTGRGLGFSGGTLDKLESIRGFRSDLSVDEFKANLRQYGIVISGQTADMVPADGLLYALRDVTATVESLPLIASSIMSKKIAAGANAIVLDVKVGRGAFMKMEEEALGLAQMMVDIGHSVGRRVTAVISDMNQPLGRAVGNALEVVEALETLRGGGPGDFLEHCLAIAGQMLLLADRVRDSKEGREVLMETLRSGQALAKFKDLVVSQGGDGAVVDDPALLPRASIVREVVAPRSGYIAGIDAMEVGLTAVDLGAGRTVKGDSVDPAVGLVLHRKIGDYVKQGEALFTLHANGEGKFAMARERMLRAYTWTDTPPTVPPLIHSVIKE